MSQERTSRTLSLTTGGITLLGVLLSIGVTVGMGLDAAWWVRVLAGLATTVVLSVVVKVGSSSGRGPLARMADWMIGTADSERADAEARAEP
jgi:hypothetical protein